MTKFRYVGSRSVPLRFVLIGVAVAAVLIITVGLLAGLLRPPCPDNCGGGSQTTAEPPQTSPGTPATPTASSTPDPSKPWLQMRLPTYQQPTHYRVRLHPRLGAEASQGYTGEVDIDLSLTGDVKYILVHVKYLSVDDTQVVTKASGTPLNLTRAFNYTANQFWVIELADLLQGQNDVVVKLKFSGHYFGIVGLYQSTYTEGGVRKFLATTKFQPTDARKAFPCMDEPQLKATYVAELIHFPNYTALANMPEEKNEILPSGLTLTTFNQTRIMSTYLFCILISQFDSRENTTAGGDPFRVWAPQSRISQASYALESGVRIQNYFGDWFKYPYESQFPKQDMAAIPDFPSGAMEHWGLITYRDTAMLFDSVDGSAANKQRVVTVVAHELAHMWFGNLVTMLWWNDLWLNEGFASFFADFGADIIEPTWELRQQGIVTTYNSAFNADDVITSHPIIVDVETPQEITQIFDTITYSKGQAVLTQLEDFMGLDNFQLGLQDYLKTNEYGVATTVQLYNSLQNYTNQNVTEFMDRWTRQMGFPLVTVVQGSTPDMLVLNQTWFLREAATRANASASPYGYEWIIKLNFGSNSSSSSSAMMQSSQLELNVSGHQTMSPPLKFNLGQKGFYRVNYPDAWWGNFSAALMNNVNAFDPVDRAGLVGDAFAVALGNQLSYATLVRFVNYLSVERHYLPWYTANSGLATITTQLARRSSYGVWAEFGRSITNSVYSNIGWGIKTSHLDKLLQPIVLNMACKFGNPNCLSEAKSRFDTWMRNGVSINTELRQIVYTYGLQQADTQEAWDFVWQKYNESDFAAERERLLRALAMTRNAWLVNRLLERSRDRNLVRGQDFVTLIGYVGANPNALEILWNWCRANWVSLLDEFGPEDRRLGAMIPNFARQFNDEFHLAEYEAFISSTQPGAGQNARQTTLAIIRSNIQWLRDNEAELIGALGGGVASQA